MNDEKKFFVGMYILWALSLGVLCLLFSSRDNLGRVESVASGINAATTANQQAEDEQRKAAAGITEAQSSAERIQLSINETRSILDQHEASLGRCQQILDRVRQRAEKKTADN